jgi:putative ABC transport system ATP-binding protein
VGLLDVPTSGSVRIIDQAVAGLGSRALARLRAQNIGFVFQFVARSASISMEYR